MGNTLSNNNPAEIFGVDHYLTDFASAETIESLGSTRFMKVARGRQCSTEAICLWKVFLIQDDSLDVEKYIAYLRNITRNLSNATNCCPALKVIRRPKCAIMYRPYLKHTLYDRLSTRPFIVPQERVWYIYQLFQALSQCQKAGICHGDLKSQNVLITSSNWLYIADFAPFKPTYLPYDNPSSFTFYFDTSRRQSCYIAPERFLSSADYEKIVKEKGDDWLFHSLVSSMDMFSAGCIVYELLLDGKSPFSYGELCGYRSMTPADAASYLERLLADVPTQFKPLLKILLNREPKMRMTATQVIEGAAFRFPKILDSWLFSYLDKFRPKERDIEDEKKGEKPVIYSLSLEPDDVIDKLRRDLSLIWANLDANEETRSFAVIFISLITSNIRALRSLSSKLESMKLLVKFCSLCESSIATERVLPYLMYMLTESDVRVRAAAIYEIVELLSPLSPSSFEDSLIFIDYLLPELTTLINGNCPILVQLAMASNLAIIAETSLRFFTIGRTLRSGLIDDECSGSENLSEAEQAADELKALSKAITDLFVVLCSCESSVRHCLIDPESLVKLHAFFSRMSNSEILLGHMITFLNAKSDWRIRSLFFDALPICVQKSCIDIKPLLQQGLTDFEETVVIRSINCISVLIDSNLLDKLSLKELLNDVLPFLLHPNDWIRASVVNFVIRLDSRWSLAEVLAYLLPRIKDYIESREDIFRFNNKTVLLNSLIEPIPREIWKSISDFDIEKTRKFVALYEKQKPGEVLCPTDNSFTRIFEMGLKREDISWKVGRFQKLFLKMAEFRHTAGMENELTMQKAIIDLSASSNMKVRRNVFHYVSKTPQPSAAEAKETRMNPEWNMYHEEATVTWNDEINHQSNSNSSMVRSSLCGSQINELLLHKNELFQRKNKDRMPKRDNRPLARGNVRGDLITHLQEHTNKVTQMSLHNDGQRLASSSRDGTIKIWNTRSMTGDDYGSVKSDASYIYPHNSVINSIGWAQEGQKLIASTGDGNIIILDTNTQPRLINQISLPPDEGAPLQLHVSNNLIFVRSHHGAIYAFDLRVGESVGLRHQIWRRQMPNHYGLITSFCIDPRRNNWMTFGCTNKKLLLWDLRFRLEVMNWQTPRTPSDMVPYKVWSNPVSSSESPEIFVSFPWRGDISVYNLAAAEPMRTKVLWPSLSEPFDYHSGGDDMKMMTSALAVCQDSGMIYTGDSHGSIRKWHPTKAPLSEYLSGPHKYDARMPYKMCYVEHNTNTDYPPVFHEKRLPNHDIGKPLVPIDMRPCTSHRSGISDIVCLHNDLLATSGADGTIKIWK